MNKICKGCSKEFDRPHKQKLYCNLACQKKYRVKKGVLEEVKKECKFCKSIFIFYKKPNSVETRIYCSIKCGYEYKRSLLAQRNPESLSGISASSKGTIGELCVSADLLKRGYEVFRALSGGASCDLCILIGKKLYKIEVTIGIVGTANQVIHSKKNVLKKNPNKFDILAIYLKHGEIIYEPKLPDLE